MMSILDMPGDPAFRERAAELLVEGFRDAWPDAWPDIESGRREVAEMVEGERICRVVVEDGDVVGWGGAIPTYRRTAWELHPLVVDKGHRKKGIGRALVRDIEEQARLRGAVTLFLGTDDEDGSTSIGGIDLYPDIALHIGSLHSNLGHPLEFYRKVGFVIVGVIPDANGPGKPDILMARRIATSG